MDAPWRIEMLGGLRATQGDRVVTRFRSHQTAGLLAYLAYYSRRSHPREELIERLWPERDPDSGRNSFRVALASLRRQLEPPGVPAGVVLVADRATLQLNPAAAVTDVAQFEAAIQAAERCGNARERAEPLAESVELYQGELLPGFFDDWILPERRRLAEAFLSALDQLVLLHEQAGDRARALQYARRAVGADPLREEAHQQVMRLLLDMGQPEAALRQYEELERLLARELDAEASPETRALARQIQERGRRAGGHAIATSAFSTSDSPPLAPRAPTSSLDQPILSSSLPTGTVTYLLSDLEGSTALPQHGREATGQSLADHAALLRQALGQHRGSELKVRGDRLLAAFQRAGDALDCAITLQRAMKEVPLRVRMALHTGDVEGLEGSDDGPVLQCAQRILLAGHGGQILCSEATAGLVRRDLDTGVELVDRGVYRLRDVTTPERLFQVAYPGMGEREFPPLKAAPAHAGRLPLQFDRFFGREAEIAQLVEMLGGIHHGDTETRRPTRRERDEIEIPVRPCSNSENVLSTPSVSPPGPGPRQTAAPPLRGEFDRSPAPSPRLVTLTGPGGTGKTRLALEVAQRLREPFRGAVWFVPLVDLRDPPLILDKTLDALGLVRDPQLDPLEQVVTTLSRQPSLLLLDTFEHLVADGAPLVQRLLELVPTLAVLTTSRQRLGLRGEHEFPVTPLPVPEEGVQVFRCSGVQDDKVRDGPAFDFAGPEHLNTRTPEHLIAYPSVQLFVDRAQAARPDFQVTRANAPAVAALCVQLEGLPLAIELAAAQARMLTPEQMRVRLEQRFELLRRRGREVDPRHGSLRATLDWSYQSLSPELQQFFTRLSVFRGGWTLEAAEAVCGGGVGGWGLGVGSDESDRSYPTPPPASRVPAQPPTPTLDLLAQLCERSLVLAEETAHASQPAEMRYRLLDTLREYAAEQLRTEQQAGLERRHAMYYCALAERAEPELQGPGQMAWLERLEQEHDNLRAALVWAEGAGTSPETGDVEIGLRLAGALWEFWAPRGHVAEGRAHLAKLLARPEASARTAVRAKALACAAILADFQGQHAAARSLHEEGLAIRRELGDTWGIDFSLTALGYVAEHQGDYAAARTFQEEALALSRERNDPVSIAWSLNNLADVTWHQGDYAAARAYFQESLEIRREMGDHWGAAFSQSGMGTMALNLGELEAARSLHEASLALRRELGDQRGIATSVTNLGHVARRQGDYPKARSLLEEGLAMQQELGDQGGAADSLYGLGWVALKEGDRETARRLLAESLSLQRELGNREALAGCLDALAGVMAATPVPAGGTRGDERFARATRLFGAAAALREALGAPLPPADRADHNAHVDTLRLALGEPAFTAAWEAGRALTWEAAVDEALAAEGKRA